MKLATFIPSGWPYAEHINAMKAIFGSRHVFEVFQSGIPFDAIFVIDFMRRRGLLGKRLHHELMNAKLLRLTVLTKSERGISSTRGLRLENAVTPSSDLERQNDGMFCDAETCSNVGINHSFAAQLSHLRKLWNSYLPLRCNTTHSAKIADFVESFVTDYCSPFFHALDYNMNLYPTSAYNG